MNSRVPRAHLKAHSPHIRPTQVRVLRSVRRRP